MKRTTCLQALVPLAAVLALPGCVSQSPIVDRHFGEAVLASQAQQTLNPDASKAPPSAPGLDGRAAKHALDRYHESFKTPPLPTKVFNIGVGQEED